jgi:hypothetical protein
MFLPPSWIISVIYFGLRVKQQQCKTGRKRLVKLPGWLFRNDRGDGACEVPSRLRPLKTGIDFHLQYGVSENQSIYANRLKTVAECNFFMDSLIIDQTHGML